MPPAPQPLYRPRRQQRPRATALGRRALPAVAVLAGLAFIVGLVLGARHVPDAQRVAERYAAAYAGRDWTALHRELTPDARRRYPVKAFADANRRALDTATATKVVAGKPREHDGRWAVPMQVATRTFGTVDADLVLPVDTSSDPAGVDWRPSLVFPGLRDGETLKRAVRLPTRATLLARDGTVLARGDARSSSDPELASSVAGRMGPVAADRQAALFAQGVPANAVVGLSGLERAFDDRLRGRPGGTLLAGRRVLARTAPARAHAIRTTIDPRVQRASLAGLAGRLGGVVALRPRTGAVLAFAGIPFSGLQPPGSTFKVITTTAALEAGVTRLSKTYPAQTAATIEGVQLQNANGESCGGTLTQAFAESCNSVFAPMGVDVGAKRLVATAERFGFNRPPDIPGVAESTLPAAKDVGDDLAVGSTAIGQGRVQATTLEMASVAAAIAHRGRMPRLTVDAAQARGDAPTRRVTSPAVARTMDRLMRAVVSGGTGTAAAIPGVAVAGKTGTAELRSTQGCTADPANPGACGPAADPTDTDAWFVAYAPAGSRRARVAVGVLLVGSGAGGAAAAPVAREVVLAALGRSG